MSRQLLLAGLALIPGLMGAGLLLFGNTGSSEGLKTRIASLSRLQQAGRGSEKKSLQKSGNSGGSLQARIMERLIEYIADAPTGLTPARLMFVGMGAGLFVAILAWVVFTMAWYVLLPVGLLVGTAAPPLVVLRARAKRKAEILASFPDALDLVVRAIRAGLPLSEAFNSLATEMPGPLAEEFRLLTGEVSIGITMEEALENAARRIDLADFRFFSASIALQRETGGNLTETLENLSQIIRRRKELQLKARAMTAEARTSSLVIGALPFVAGGALAILNPEYIGKLFSDPRGAYVLGAACASMICGVITMQIMIKRAVN